MYESDKMSMDEVSEPVSGYESLDDLENTIKILEKDMKQAAKELSFEKASELRDRIHYLKKVMVFEV
jgi:excinuclease ABC subunit B